MNKRTPPSFRPFPRDRPHLGPTPPRPPSRVARQTALRGEAIDILAFALANHADFADIHADARAGCLSVTVEGRRYALFINVSETL